MMELTRKVMCGNDVECLASRGGFLHDASVGGGVDFYRVERVQGCFTTGCSSRLKIQFKINLHDLCLNFCDRNQLFPNEHQGVNLYRIKEVDFYMIRGDRGWISTGKPSIADFAVESLCIQKPARPDPRPTSQGGVLLQDECTEESRP